MLNGQHKRLVAGDPSSILWLRQIHKNCTRRIFKIFFVTMNFARFSNKNTNNESDKKWRYIYRPFKIGVRSSEGGSSCSSSYLVAILFLSWKRARVSQTGSLLLLPQWIFFQATKLKFSTTTIGCKIHRTHSHSHDVHNLGPKITADSVLCQH